MQRDVHKFAYLVQRLQIELNVYFFIGCGAKTAEDDETELKNTQTHNSAIAKPVFFFVQDTESKRLSCMCLNVYVRT